jgi:hypothetical protein
MVNHLTPNDHFSGRTAPLTSRRCILYIYSTNIRTEYFKRAAHSPFFPLQTAVYFIMLPFFGSCIIHILYTGVLKFKRKFRRQKVKRPKLEADHLSPSIASIKERSSSFNPPYTFTACTLTELSSPSINPV